MFIPGVPVFVKRLCSTSDAHSKWESAAIILVSWRFKLVSPGVLSKLINVTESSTAPREKHGQQVALIMEISQGGGVYSRFYSSAPENSSVWSILLGVNAEHSLNDWEFDYGRIIFPALVYSFKPPKLTQNSYICWTEVSVTFHGGVVLSADLSSLPLPFLPALRSPKRPLNKYRIPISCKSFLATSLPGKFSFCWVRSLGRGDLRAPAARTGRRRLPLSPPGCAFPLLALRWLWVSLCSLRWADSTHYPSKTQRMALCRAAASRGLTHPLSWKPGHCY